MIECNIDEYENELCEYQFELLYECENELWTLISCANRLSAVLIFIVMDFNIKYEVSCRIKTKLVE